MFDITAIMDLGSKILDRVMPDPAAKAAAQLELMKLTQTGELAQLAADTDLAKGAADIVKTEASSGNWLSSSWRPLLMLTFGGLIVARWFGWAAPNLTEAEYLKLWDIVQLGLGGYVIGRTGEKVVSMIAPVVSQAITNKAAA
jgi:hypothetical protein